ncbi:hypothetical protein [Maricaulis parjimensis]|uniref:hypothetical protein n=1 Tax=Maricaulis parjimensis TaxID=144023 RepID=UPI0019399243|nr:hypothetical protein [Maricaulis parjimensis]
MFYLVWQMGLLLLAAIAAGVFIGYQIWSGDARSAEADKALAENARLRQENENLARRLGEASVKATPVEAKPAEAKPAEAKPVAAPVEDAKPEPVAEPAKPKPAAKPKSAAKPKAAAKAKATPKPASPAGQDDLTKIKGLGPKAAAALQAGGVTRFADIAEWTETDVEVWDDRINGRGRIVRDQWVEQAKSLSA